MSAAQVPLERGAGRAAAQASTGLSQQQSSDVFSPMVLPGRVAIVGFKMEPSKDTCARRGSWAQSPCRQGEVLLSCPQEAAQGDTAVQCGASHASPERRLQGAAQTQ